MLVFNKKLHGRYCDFSLADIDFLERLNKIVSGILQRGLRFSYLAEQFELSHQLNCDRLSSQMEAVYKTKCLLEVARGLAFETNSLSLHHRLMHDAAELLNAELCLVFLVHCDCTSSLFDPTILSLVGWKEGSLLCRPEWIDRTYISDGIRMYDGEESGDFAAICIPSDVGFVGMSVSSDKTMVAKSNQDFPFNWEIDQRTGILGFSGPIVTSVCVPLRNKKNQVIGVLQMINSRSKRPFCTHDVSLLTQLASIAGLAVERVNYLDRCNLEEQELRNEAQEGKEVIAQAIERISTSLVAKRNDLHTSQSWAGTTLGASSDPILQSSSPSALSIIRKPGMPLPSTPPISTLERQLSCQPQELLLCEAPLFTLFLEQIRVLFQTNYICAWVWTPIPKNEFQESLDDTIEFGIGVHPSKVKSETKGSWSSIWPNRGLTLTRVDEYSLNLARTSQTPVIWPQNLANANIHSESQNKNLRHSTNKKNLESHLYMPFLWNAYINAQLHAFSRSSYDLRHNDLEFVDLTKCNLVLLVVSSISIRVGKSCKADT